MCILAADGGEEVWPRFLFLPKRIKKCIYYPNKSITREKKYD